jgi:hypothetical protein
MHFCQIGALKKQLLWMEVGAGVKIKVFKLWTIYIQTLRTIEEYSASIFFVKEYI